MLRSPVQLNPSVQTPTAPSSSGHRFLARRAHGIRRLVRRFGRQSIALVFLCLALALLIALGYFWPQMTVLARYSRPSVDLNWTPRHVREAQLAAATRNISTIQTSRGGNTIWAGPRLPAKHLNELKWHYAAIEKAVPYVGHPEWMEKMKPDSRQYLNSLAVHPKADDDHMHGHVGLRNNGEAVWKGAPMPPPIDKFPGGSDAALKNGGFYLDLSDALPLDRKVKDARDKVCKQVEFDYTDLPDASVVITFFNEPLSTLLRSVHSILNYTPPPLLREIILVDDHSNHPDVLPGGPLYELVAHLPKVKIMRLPEREGIVRARLAGAKASRGDVFVVLDSHIEVNPGWLEPQLARIRESPQTIMFPQILALGHDTFEYKQNSGIGCYLTFRWSIVEQATIGGVVSNSSPVASPSMAGGLFAVDRDWFFELGGYDEGFIAWGAENVEMAFRAWMCGGRVECAPCAKTYHIYRKGGSGYTNPMGALWVNRKRTARVWMDEFYQVATKLIDISASRGSEDDVSDESIVNMLELKERLHCKSFRWYLDNVDPKHDMQHLSDIVGLGRLRQDERCVDASNGRTVGAVVKSYPCHRPEKYSGSQGYMILKNDSRLRLMANDKRCLSFHNQKQLTIEQCSDSRKSAKWEAVKIEEPDGFKLKWNKTSCLSLNKTTIVSDPILVDCESPDISTMWRIDQFEPDPTFQLPNLTQVLQTRRSRKLRRQPKQRPPLPS